MYSTELKSVFVGMLFCVSYLFTKLCDFDHSHPMSHPAPSQPHVSAYAAELAAEPPRTLGAWVTLFKAVVLQLYAHASTRSRTTSPTPRQTRRAEPSS